MMKKGIIFIFFIFLSFILWLFIASKRIDFLDNNFEIHLKDVKYRVVETRYYSGRDPCSVYVIEIADGEELCEALNTNFYVDGYTHDAMQLITMIHEELQPENEIKCYKVLVDKHHADDKLVITYNTTTNLYTLYYICF